MLEKEDGSALVLTLIIIFVLVILISGLSYLLSGEIRFVKYEEDRNKAFYIAEAGIEYALTIFEDDDSWDESGNLNSVLLNNISGIFDGTLSSLSMNEVEGTTTIQATGIVDDVSVDLEVDVSIVNTGMVFDRAVFSDTDINISGSSTVNGNLATNTGVISLTGNPNINGDIYIGPEADPEIAVVYPHNYNLDSEIYKEDSERTYTLPEFPDFPDNLPYRGNFTTPWVPGTYYEINQDGEYNTISATSNRTITIDLGGGERTIRVRNLNISQGHIELINIGNGKLTLYVDDYFTLNGSSTINNNGNPDDVFMYYKGSNTINPSGSTKFIGSIYAETADISITGSGGITGHIISGGETINISGDSSAHVRALLAPEATVNVSGSGSLSGAIVCDTINMSGDTTVNYQEFNDIGLPEIIEEGESEYSIVWK